MITERWQVEEDAAEKGKKIFTLHKQIVWHAAFRKFLKTIVLHSKTGIHHKCANDIVRWLFPLILILSADYEEQYVIYFLKQIHPQCHLHSQMCNGSNPWFGLPMPLPQMLCFMGFVIGSFSRVWSLNCRAHTQKILREASQLSAGGKEELLKQHGLREVEESLYFPELLALAYVWDIERNFWGWKFGCPQGIVTRPLAHFPWRSIFWSSLEADETSHRSPRPEGDKQASRWSVCDSSFEFTCIILNLLLPEWNHFPDGAISITLMQLWMYHSQMDQNMRTSQR